MEAPLKLSFGPICTMTSGSSPDPPNNLPIVFQNLENKILFCNRNLCDRFPYTICPSSNDVPYHQYLFIFAFIPALMLNEINIHLAARGSILLQPNHATVHIY